MTAARWTALALALVGCSPAKPGAEVRVEPPGDNSCIGVVGFVATLTGVATTSYTSMRRLPVLEAGQCRLDSPIVVGDVDVGSQLSLTVYGYDSLRSPLVKGDARLGSIDAPGAAAIPLASVWSDPYPVLVVDRSSVAGFTSLADVTRIDIATVAQKTTVLSVAVDAEARPFFVATEPGAFAITTKTLTDGEDVTVTLTTASAAISDRFTLSNQGVYWALGPGKGKP
jgi:hypothetical protein